MQELLKGVKLSWFINKRSFMKKTLILSTLPLFSLLLPLVASAQASDISGFVQVLIDVINGVLVPLILAIAFIAFIWGVFRFFIASNEETKDKGRDLMVYGLIGFVVIISVWGIVNLLVNTFSLDVNPDFRSPEARDTR